MVRAVLTYIMLILIAIICAGPFIWLLAASFRSGQNIYDISLIPENPTVGKLRGRLGVPFGAALLLNTVIITVGSIVLDVILSALCAYPLACMRFKGKNVVLSLLLASMIIPAAAGMIINYLTILGHASAGYPGGCDPGGSVKVFSIILMRQGYLGVPKDLIEAARIDGAGELRIWWQIMLPGIMPTISTVIILTSSALERVPVAHHRAAGSRKVPPGRRPAVSERLPSTISSGILPRRYYLGNSCHHCLYPVPEKLYRSGQRRRQGLIGGGKDASWIFRLD